MAPAIASTASARIESRRCPPVFISPGPIFRCAPSSSWRAITASADSRTSSARARVRVPSSALGQRWNNASATSRLTSASPRNSSRSLWGLPALRWVRARASSAALPKAWPAKASPTAPGMASFLAWTTVLQVLGGVELADHVEVADDRFAHLVGHPHPPAAFDALDLDVVGLDILGVVHVQPPGEQVADVV